MRVVNTNAVSYQSQKPEMCLDISEKEKKKKYLYACLNERQKFTPFVTSVDLLLGFKAEATLKYIASHPVTKWKDPYSRTCGYVKIRVAITIVRAIHCCNRGARLWRPKSV